MSTQKLLFQLEIYDVEIKKIVQLKFKDDNINDYAVNAKSLNSSHLTKIITNGYAFTIVDTKGIV